MTVALDDPRTAALGACAVATEGRRFVDHDRGDLELVDVRAVVVLGVGNRRLEHLAQNACAFLRHERERGQRFINALATNHVGNEPALLWRNARVAQLGCNLHLATLP